MSRHIDEIIIHCSATPSTMDIGVDTIYDWHVNGNKWSDVGYHYVIRRNGEIELGRDINEAGAHCRGHNSYSIGICMVGGIDTTKEQNPENNFTSEQFESLYNLVTELKISYGIGRVSGHNEYDAHKACPSFDVQDWLDVVEL